MEKYLTLPKDNEYELSPTTWDDEVELPQGSYLTLEIQHYFILGIIKKYETAADNPLIQTYVSGIESKITFKIEEWYRLETWKYLEALQIDDNQKQN